MFAPLFAGALLRRDRGVWALFAGGCVGVATRLATAYYKYGDPFFYKGVHGTVFSLAYVQQNFLLHGLALLVFVPGGLLFAVLYRGRRRPEVVVTILVFVAFYLGFVYSGQQSGMAKQLVLSHRYLLPVVPLLVFAMAESVERGWRRLADRWSGSAHLQRVSSAAVWLWLVGVCIAAIAVHPVHASWSGSQREIRIRIEEFLTEDSVVVTNWGATGKVWDLLRGRYLPIDRDSFTSEQLRVLLERHDRVLVVLLDRSDSGFWRLDAHRNEGFLEFLRGQRVTKLDEQITATDRLRIIEYTREAASE